MTTDDKIKAAAKALGDALTEGGKYYYVSTETFFPTTLGSDPVKYVWSVAVDETASRRIAP